MAASLELRQWTLLLRSPGSELTCVHAFTFQNGAQARLFPPGLLDRLGGVGGVQPDPAAKQAAAAARAPALPAILIRLTALPEAPMNKGTGIGRRSLAGGHPVLGAGWEATADIHPPPLAIGREACTPARPSTSTGRPRRRMNPAIRGRSSNWNLCVSGSGTSAQSGGSTSAFTWPPLNGETSARMGETRSPHQWGVVRARDTCVGVGRDGPWGRFPFPELPYPGP